VYSHVGRRGLLPERRRIVEAMRLLPVPERETLAFALHSGWSVDRLATHFGLSRELVMERLHDALVHLRDQLPTS
jgi:DNA-directed RNA polymerase specialized sigma24 family protein